MPRTLARLGLAVAAALSSGCATLAKGSSQSITVATDPSGAICTLTRDTKPLAVVNPTPGSIPVEKGKGSIAVICKRKAISKPPAPWRASSRP